MCQGTHSWRSKLIHFKSQRSGQRSNCCCCPVGKQKEFLPLSIDILAIGTNQAIHTRIGGRFPPSSTFSSQKTTVSRCPIPLGHADIRPNGPTASARDRRTYWTYSVRIQDSESGEAGPIPYPVSLYPGNYMLSDCLTNHSYARSRILPWPYARSRHQAISRQTTIWRSHRASQLVKLPTNDQQQRASRGSDCSINLRVLRDRGRESFANPRASDHQS